jgi:dTDP-4-dehydrorhamnose reductase
LRLFITGVSGLFGSNLALQRRPMCESFGSYLTHPVQLDGVRTFWLDLRAADDVKSSMVRIRPDVVVHAAGLTDVEACELRRRNACIQNVRVAVNVARAAASVGARLVHVSTDHLFSGHEPFASEDDLPAPRNVYGRTKWYAERLVAKVHSSALIIRTNFFGWGPVHRRSFSDWIIDSLEGGRDITLFKDVFYSPILVNHLADLIFDLLAHRMTGIFNVCSRERVSKHEFGLKLAAQFGLSASGIHAGTIEAWPHRASRPRDMSLDVTKVEAVLGMPMPTVAQGLEGLADLRRAAWNEKLRGSPAPQRQGNGHA